MDKVVVSVGGSVLIPGNNDSEYISRLAGMLSSVKDEVQLAVVCGGGRTARYYATTGRELGGDTYQLDIMGIAATRINAQLLGVALGDMPERVPETAAETAATSAANRLTGNQKSFEHEKNIPGGGCPVAAARNDYGTDKEELHA